MQHKFIVRLICALMLSATSLYVKADEITIPYKGLTLNASYELANGNQVTDEVILITHGSLAHRDMEIISNLQSQLKGRGHNTLAINLSLGISSRHGMYDCKQTHRHQNADAVDEIAVWVNWLAKQGVRQVTLLGHSRGAAQTALYAVENNNPKVKALVLLAPPTRNNGGAGYQQRYQQPLEPILEQAQQQLFDGKGDTVLKHVNMMFCRDVEVTAASFVSYFGPNPALDTPSLMPLIRTPTLVVVAGDDEVVLGLEKRVSSLADGKLLKMNVIEGAGHFFRDIYADDAIEAIEDFLAEVASQRHVNI